MSTWSIAIAPNTDSEDDKGLNLKEAALLAVGVGGLTMAVMGKIGLMLAALANRGLRLMPAGQVSLILSLAVGALVVLAIVAAVLRPTGASGKAIPLMGVVLVGSGILSALIA